MYIIGIDGGASKTEFAVADLKGNILDRFTIDFTCSPFYRGNLENTEKVFSEGFERISKDYDLKKVRFCYAGISGCWGDKRFNAKIEKLLMRWIKNCKAEGDLHSSFRSLTDQSIGILAIAGSGTAVEIFLENELINFTGIGIGGKDYAYGIEYLLLNGIIKQDSEIGKLVLCKHSMKDIEAMFYDRRGLNNEIMHSINKILSTKSSSDKKLQNELKIINGLFVARWMYKLTGHTYKYDLHKLKSFDLVLSGSMWKWDLLRESLIKNLKKTIPNAKILYNPRIRPVEGCVKIAVEKIRLQGRMSS
ncbi:MAG: hypothetical protein PHS44_01880 [Candidatus Dojkabacteria bacterium]|nr:hypothetical protein [Candidatus Dojkabacteria bacterium]